ncbi:hypothetical protein ACHQJC_17500 [Raoultella planticola]|uniref:hypothetical protein n=1 Tax=Raoultella planticola TaxID=575 RepID=UPI003891183C
MIADMTGIPVVKPLISDEAALGAAIQAHWSFIIDEQNRSKSIDVCIPDFLSSSSAIVIDPNEKTTETYRCIYDAYHIKVNELSNNYSVTHVDSGIY